MVTEPDGNDGDGGDDRPVPPSFLADQAALRVHQEAVAALRDLGIHLVSMSNHLASEPWEDEVRLLMDRQGEDKLKVMQAALKRFSILRDCCGGMH